MIKIISENVDGKRITNEATIEEWKKDFWNECNFVPANDDIVFYVSVNSKEISLEEIAGKYGDGQFSVYFEHVANYLGLWNNK